MRRRVEAMALMSASGFAGLGYQIVWTRQVAPWLGHEAAAVLAVVTAFFGGLAVGASLLGPTIERSADPARWYVACEALIGAWALVLVVAISPFGSIVMDAIGAEPTPMRQWIVVFASTFLLFLPATAAMGATLPAIERALIDPADRHRSLAAPYAWNTLGAVSGVLCTTFGLIPSLGLARTAMICAVVSLACAGGAWFVLPRSVPALPAPTLPASSRGVLVRLGVTGLLGIGYEILVVRVLSQVAEDTVYTFAMLLAVYLAGTTIGAAIDRRVRKASDDLRILGDRLTVLLAAACLLGTGALWFSERLRDGMLDLLPTGIGSALATEATIAIAAFALPTVMMGMLFAALCDRACADGSSFGRAIGCNTFGAACAPCLFGVLLVPAAGPKASLLLVAAGYLATTLPRGVSRVVPWLVATTAAVLAIATPPLAFVDVPLDGRVVAYQDGITASVSIVEDAAGIDRLRIDNRQQEGTSATAFVDGRQALLPLLLHPGPHRALFLGLGTGVTASIAARMPELDVDAVELLPEVITASLHFRDLLDDGVPNPRLHVIAADARRYVRASRTDYDVIVADNFHPARSGSGALYTVEHFRAIRARLAVDGVFCQWLPLHQLDLRTLRSIAASFVEVFPHGFAILANNSLDTPVIGLVAQRDAGLFEPAVVDERIERVTGPRLASFGVDDAFSVLGSVVMGPASLARFAGDAPLNRDDRPVVAWLAPRATYAPQESPRERLTALLAGSSVEPDELVDRARDPDFAARLAAYRVARDRFIAIGKDVRPTDDVVAMLAQVRVPLLSVLGISPDFRPAYDPLLRMGSALSRVDAVAAEALLTDLARVQPVRAEAPSLLRVIQSGLQADRNRPAGAATRVCSQPRTSSTASPRSPHTTDGCP